MFVVFNLVPSTSASDSSTESTLRSILRPHVHLQTPYHRPQQETQPPRSRPINVPLREAHEAAGKYITVHSTFTYIQIWIHTHDFRSSIILLFSPHFFVFLWVWDFYWKICDYYQSILNVGTKKRYVCMKSSFLAL